MSDQKPAYFRVQDIFKNINYITVAGGKVSYASANGTPLALSNLLQQATFETEARLRVAPNAEVMLAILVTAVSDQCVVTPFNVEVNAQSAGFTVFLRAANNEGTTHISYQVGDRDEAVQLAIAECHADWGWDGDDDDLHVLGVAAGDVAIVEWDDQV